MEIIGNSLVAISLSISIVFGSFVFIRAIYFLAKALSHTNKEVASRNRYISFNFTNAIWIHNGLTEVGCRYRTKALVNLGVFMVLIGITIFLA